MSDTFVQNESIETLIHRYKSTIYGVACRIRATERMRTTSSRKFSSSTIK